MSEELSIITLEDAIGNRCQVQLSPEDALRCDTDLAFATSFKWGHSAVLLVVDAYRNHVTELTAGKISQKKVWERISTIMAEKGHMVSGPQCMSKFNGMKRTFKSISDHNSKSGNSPRSWPYFDLMQSLLGERPFMEPPALSSSSSNQMTGSKSSKENIDDPAPLPGDSRSRKRQASEGFKDLTNANLESRRIAEEGKNRRHNERTAQKAAIMAKIDGLLDKF